MKPMNENLKTYAVILEILDVVEYTNLNDLMMENKTNENIAKIRNICYGIVRNYYAITFIIQKLIKRENVELTNIIKIGVFELWFSNKPEYAIINDLVELTKKISASSTNGNFVNAVLRNFQKNKNELIEKVNQDYLLKYNLPNWFLDKLKKQYKGNYFPIIQSLMLHPSFGLRVNTRLITSSKYLELLKQQNIEYNIVDEKLILTKPINIKEIPGFENGLVSIQDIAAQYLVNILKNNSVHFSKALDACSAPGGKTCQLLENYDCGLTSVDIDATRIAKVKENLDRLKLKAKIIIGDSANQKWWDGEKFDLIVADVPCSATGTIKRNPDIKINRSESDLNKFVDTQRKIINNLWCMLVENGYMVYITCSIFKEENQINIDWFKQTLNGFNVIDEIQIFPSEHSDGLYYCLVKKENKI